MVLRSLLLESFFLLCDFLRKLNRTVPPSLFYSTLSTALATGRRATLMSLNAVPLAEMERGISTHEE